MADTTDRFADAIAELDAVADDVTADEAAATFNETTLQNFWREWPHISGWAGALWRKLNEDIEHAAAPATDEDLHEVGDAGAEMASLGEIMTKDVYATTGDTPVVTAAETMVKRRHGSAVVMEGGWLAGIFTERDVLRAAASGKDLHSTPVSEWMTRDPQTATADMDSEEAAQIMVANGFRHLPVMEGNTVAGIVSLRDVLGARIARSAR